MALDSYHCVVCGAADDLWRMRDVTCTALLCGQHWDLMHDPRFSGKPLKEKLESFGVKFGEQPMDLNYKDEDFCRDCGIKYPEPWEIWAAMHEKDGVKELEAPKEKKDGNDVLKKRTRSNRKF